jgi:hypothetical protein
VVIEGPLAYTPRMFDDLFSRAAAKDRSLSPLADRMRPTALDEFVGQEHLMAPGRFLERAIAADKLVTVDDPCGDGTIDVGLIFYETPASMGEKLTYANAMRGFEFWTVAQMADDTGASFPNLEALIP